MRASPSVRRHVGSLTLSTPELGQSLTLVVAVGAVVRLMRALLETSWRHRMAFLHALSLVVVCSVLRSSAQRDSPE